MSASATLSTINNQTHALPPVFTRESIGNNVKMNTNSNLNKHSHLSPRQGEDGMHTKNQTGGFDMEKRDRFELLSAYLDGEVTASERQQVQAWLDHDPEIKQLYRRLLRLRQGVRTLPVPAPSQPVEETVQRVLKRVKRRGRLTVLFGGAAIAACALGGIGLFNGNGSSTPQLAQEPLEQAQTYQKPSAPLMVALNDPIFPIPKTHNSSPESDQIDVNLDNVDREIN